MNLDAPVLPQRAIWSPTTQQRSACKWCAGCLLIIHACVRALHTVFQTPHAAGPTDSRRQVNISGLCWLIPSQGLNIQSFYMPPICIFVYVCVCVCAFSSTEYLPHQRHSETIAADIPTFLSGQRFNRHGQEPGNGHSLQQFW